jgi:hypothetical protein
MKVTVFVLVFALAAGGLFAEDDTDALKAVMDAAASQRTTGVILTVAGGIFLAGGFVSFLIESVVLGSEGYGSVGWTSEMTMYTSWLVSSIVAMGLGAAGLGVGIPFMIIGNVRYNNAKNRLKAAQPAEPQSWHPFMSITPYPCGLKAGVLLDL